MYRLKTKKCVFVAYPNPEFAFTALESLQQLSFGGKTAQVRLAEHSRYIPRPYVEE